MSEEEAKEINETLKQKNFITKQNVKQANNEEVTRKIFEEEGVDYLA